MQAVAGVIGAWLALNLITADGSPARRPESLREVSAGLCSGGDAEIVKLLSGKSFGEDARNRIIAVIGKSRKRLGECTGVLVVDEKQGMVRFNHRRGMLDAKVYIGDDAKIAGIWLGREELTLKDYAELNKIVTAMAGEVGVAVVREADDVLYEHDGDKLLAVGSVSKLIVLRAVIEEVGCGRLGWRDVVAMEDRDKSLPSGILQDWPSGAPITIHSLAALMLSISDNTAADILLRKVGRTAVERYAGRHNIPFLSTSEMFKLRQAGEAMTKRYKQGVIAERRRHLSEMDKVLLAQKYDASMRPAYSDVEWYYTAREVCQIAYAVRDNELFGINTGLARRDQWGGMVRYKGGSEPGVISMVHLLQERRDAPIYCIAATWNGDGGTISEGEFINLVSAMMEIVYRTAEGDSGTGTL